MEKPSFPDACFNSGFSLIRVYVENGDGIELTDLLAQHAFVDHVLCVEK